MRIFVEADSIAQERMHGIGHFTLEILKVLDKTPEHKTTAIVPFEKRHHMKKYGLKNIKVRYLPIGYKYVNYALTRTSLPLPVDLWYGKGLYIFPNYKNWYVPFSRSITVVHDAVFSLHPDTVHPKNLVYMKANIQRWLKRADKIMSISKQSAREVAEAFPVYRDQIFYNYLAADTKHFQPRLEIEVARVRQKYDIKKEYFLALGNIEPRKNTLRVLESYERYSAEVDDPAQLVLVGGDGWRNDDILAKIAAMQAAGLDVLRPEVYVEDEDIPALYTGAKALVHIAIHEGFGLTPIEALACGTPVIAADIPVLQEVLAEMPKVQFVPPTDTAAIVRAMTAVRKVDQAPVISSRFSWEKTVEKMLRYGGEK